MPKSKQIQASDPYLSREQVARELNISARTLARQVDDQTFPRPTQVSKRRVGWRKSVVDSVMAARDRHLVGSTVKCAQMASETLTVADVAELLPDLMARYVSDLTGTTVDAASVTVAVKATAEQSARIFAGQTREHLALQRLINTQLSDIEAFAVASWLFPQLESSWRLESSRNGRAWPYPEGAALEGIAIALLGQAAQRVVDGDAA